MQPTENVLALAMDMMDAAEHDRYRTPNDRATLFRDGLLIGVLVLTALRRENLASIRVGKQLARRGDRLWLSYDPASMKGGERFEFAFPEVLVPFLERFLDSHRQVLLNCSKKSLPPTDALWISQHGTHMTSSAIALQVKARTEEAFGVPINPHTFRHMAATTVATSDAGHAHEIKDLLGHLSDRPADKYYNKAKMVDAGRRHQGTIDALRKRNLNG
jgi:integrase